MCAASNLLLGVAVLVVLTAFAAAASSRNVSGLKCYEGKNEDYKEGTSGCRTECTIEITPDTGDIIRGCALCRMHDEDCILCNKNLCNEVVNATAFPDRLKCYDGKKYDGKPGAFKEKFCAKNVKYCMTEYTPAIRNSDSPIGIIDIPGRTVKSCNIAPCEENWSPGDRTCADCKENLCNAAISIVCGGIGSASIFLLLLIIAFAGFISSVMPLSLFFIGGVNDGGGLHFPIV